MPLRNTTPRFDLDERTAAMVHRGLFVETGRTETFVDDSVDDGTCLGTEKAPFHAGDPARWGCSSEIQIRTPGSSRMRVEPQRKACAGFLDVDRQIIIARHDGDKLGESAQHRSMTQRWVFMRHRHAIFSLTLPYRIATESNEVGHSRLRSISVGVANRLLRWMVPKFEARPAGIPCRRIPANR